MDKICSIPLWSFLLETPTISLSGIRKLRPFVCSICGSDFGRKNGLRRHTLMVHTDMTHDCPFPQCTHPGYKCRKVLLFSFITFMLLLNFSELDVPHASTYVA